VFEQVATWCFEYWDFVRYRLTFDGKSLRHRKDLEFLGAFAKL